MVLGRPPVGVHADAGVSRLGVDSFPGTFKGQYRIVHRADSVAIKRALAVKP
jgi:hypothetical protein